MKVMTTIVAATIGAAIAATLALPAAAQDREGWPETLTIGTGGEGGTYLSYGGGFAALVGEALGLDAATEITEGAVGNVALVQTGKVGMAFATLGPADEARRGESPEMPGVEQTDVRALFPMYQTPLQVIVPADSGIATLADLDGRKVGIGPHGTTADTYWPRYFAAAGMDVTLSYAGPMETAEELADGTIDAFVYAAGVPTDAIAWLADAADVRFLGLDGGALQTMLEAVPAMSPYVMPADTYADQPEDVQTVSMWNVAIANADMPESLAYALTALAMGDHARMAAVHPAATETLPDNVGRNTVVPYHPGAVRWFREHGYGVPEGPM